jgi:hypothetical protein
MTAVAGAVAAPETTPRRLVAYGLLWGLGVSAMGIADMPWADLTRSELMLLLTRLIPASCLQGLALMLAVMALEHRRISAHWAVASLLGFTMASYGLDWLIWKAWQLPAASAPAWAIQPMYFHTLWANLFYGALFIAIYRLSVAAERSRRLFAGAEIAREQTEALLGAERVRALKGQIDPALLLRVMTEVERRHPADPSGMARLLDRLVAFLRAAMPGVRSGTSTLAAEIALATEYSRLRTELDPGSPVWRIRTGPSIPDMPFPAMLLLPVLDRWIGSAASPAELHLTDSGRACVLRLCGGRSGNADWLPADLTYRLQVGLRTVFGDAWQLTIGAPPGAALTISMPHREGRDTSAALPSFPTVQETADG